MGPLDRTHPVRERRLEDWIHRYGTAVLRLCFVYLSDAAQAEDAMQDTFLKAWRNMEQFEARNSSSEKTWLMSIAINTCRDYYRSQWFRHIDASKTPENLPESMLSVPAEERMLMLDILRLPEKYKQVLLLYYYQDMTLEDVAHTLNTSRSTVHHRLKRAEALLKRTLTGGELDEA